LCLAEITAKKMISAKRTIIRTTDRAARVKMDRDLALRAERESYGIENSSQNNNIGQDLKH